jgi:hypothetical protein
MAGMGFDDAIEFVHGELSALDRRRRSAMIGEGGEQKLHPCFAG